MEVSAPTFLVTFGDKIKWIDCYISTWRASDWKNWVCLFALIFLHDRLPDYDYYYFDLLSEAMTLATSHSISHVDFVTIRKNLTIFIEYYEWDVYQYKWGYLSAMLFVYHYLIHIIDYIELAGPAWVF